jgi:hypothetical protein
VGKAARKKRERRARKMSKLSLTIMMEEDGRIGVNGPIDNKILCYGMLELAKQAIQAYEPGRKIVTPNGSVPVNLEKGQQN